MNYACAFERASPHIRSLARACGGLPRACAHTSSRSRSTCRDAYHPLPRPLIPCRILQREHASFGRARLAVGFSGRGSHPPFPRKRAGAGVRKGPSCANACACGILCARPRICAEKALAWWTRSALYWGASRAPQGARESRSHARQSTGGLP